MISFLFVDSERVWRGGQDQLITLLPGLLDRGHRVHLVCHPGSILEDRSREAGVQVHPLAIRSEVGLISFFRLLRVIRLVRPDILAFNTPRAILPGNLASRFAPVRARIIFRRVNFRLRSNLFTRMKYNWGIDCIIAISESIHLQLLAGGVPAARIRTIYEGLDLSRFPKREAPRRCAAGAPVVVGTVAHLGREKGLRYLVEAASMIPDVRSRMRFVIVGDGECRKELEALVEKHGLQQAFRFAGFQEHTRPYLESFDLFVLPSLSEGLSSAILSAMANCLPVVATEVGGIPELILHEHNGLLVPPADPAALAAAIQRLADNPEEAFRMGRRGRSRVEDRFTLRQKILETETLCSALLTDSPPVSQAAHA